MREKILGLVNETSKDNEEKFENVCFISNFSDFENIFSEYIINGKLKIDNIKTIKTIYRYKEYFHKLLYENEIIIDIEFNNKNINSCFLFYLYLLITDKENFINYHYDWEAIVKINNLISIYGDKITKIVIAKIVNCLIYNYKGFDDYDNKKYLMHLLKIENLNKKIIKDNIEYLKALKLDEKKINNTNIDELYIEIFISLIKQNLLGKYEYTQFFENLDFDLIDLPEAMVQKLSDFFKSEKSINNYIITKENMTEKEKETIINFYYYLFKYILKKSINLYKFPLYLNNKSKILKLLKKNPNKLIIHNLDKSLKIKYEYVLKVFLDSKYYEKCLERIYNSKKKNKQLKENDSKSKFYNIIDFKEEISLTSQNSDNYHCLIDTKYCNLPEINFINKFKINEKTTAFLSNSLYSKGEDIIIFYDTKENKVQKKIEGYPFNNNINSIDIFDNKRRSYLIITCGIISANQKYGILLIDLEILDNDNDDKEYIQFFETGKEFFAQSVCHIIDSNSEERKKLNIYTEINSYIASNEEYVIVGGFDESKCCGIVKLSRISFEEKCCLEILDEIILYDNDYPKLFEDSVHYIKQEDNGEIKFGFNHTMYVCKRPNLDAYIKEENNNDTV